MLVEEDLAGYVYTGAPNTLPVGGAESLELTFAGACERPEIEWLAHECAHALGEQLVLFQADDCGMTIEDHLEESRSGAGEADQQHMAHGAAGFCLHRRTVRGPRRSDCGERRGERAGVGENA